MKPTTLHHCGMATFSQLPDHAYQYAVWAGSGCTVEMKKPSEVDSEVRTVTTYSDLFQMACQVKKIKYKQCFSNS
ncbi:hypothetical protein BN873_490081 [Candidatus Competibacter denitrificans Run_A_D11]|uniref:Uncharacterized protein n=1 Tax=Candidatus Competibacter denitrificans Run_A_D11 TaxID=1400863 RepID=W6M705_9GAMM|nr:hypothetical protein BN873_490081 [Candidatus Competibacter denitrificans Run_A_D11]